MSPTVEVLCAGILVADHVCTPVSHVPAPGEVMMAERLLLTVGGCAANTAVDLGKMGVRAGVVGRVGGDRVGRVLADMLADTGCEVGGVLVSPRSDTSQTLIINVAGQDRRFIHSFGANADFTAADIPRERVRASKVLYLGGYLLMGVDPAGLAAIFADARAHGVRTVLDVVTPGRRDYLPELAPVLPHTDVFLPNIDEATLITGLDDPLAQAEQFRRMGAGTVVVTCGSAGSVLVGEKVRLRAGSFPVEYVDGSGSGDAFDAGYIYGLLNGLGPEDCLRVASALGASCVTAVGTTPGVFTRPQCEEFLRTHSLPIERL
jgi:sugar/nucleoside kinase (ribokinase family)